MSWWNMVPKDVVPLGYDDIVGMSSIVSIPTIEVGVLPHPHQLPARILLYLRVECPHCMYPMLMCWGHLRAHVADLVQMVGLASLSTFQHLWVRCALRCSHAWTWVTTRELFMGE